MPDASTVDFGALAKATSKIAADANAEGVRSQISKELGGFQNQIPQGVDAQALAKWVSLVPQAIQKQLAGVLASVPAELQPLTVAAIPALALAAVAVSASRAANAPSSPYPREVYDAAAAKAYYDAHPLEYLSRLAYIAGTASTFGATLALDYLTGSLERNAERRADALTDLLTRLGPTYIKVGQALSIRSDLVPPAYLKSLTQLQDKVPAVPTAVAKQIIEAELGRPADEVFSGIEGSPIAAASLGQVYRARLRTDPEQEVAVKVQRPDMIKQVALDMHVLRSNGGLLRLAGYVGDVEGLVDDWGVGFVNELNYQEEARNSAQFMQEIAKTPLADSVFAPEVVLEASGKRVLTTKWIHGERLEKSSADDITGLCSIAMNTYLTMMLETGTMHCDPHPGNLLRTPEGKLCILDWGLVQNIGKDRRYRFIEHIAHLVSRDLDKVPQDLLDLGFIPENQAAVILNEENTAGIAAVYTEIMGGGGAAKIDVTKVLTQLEDLVDKYGQLFQVPPYFAYIARAFSVLEGIGLSNNPDYSIIVECLPYVSQRLLTDDNPRTAGALNTFVFGADKDNKMRLVDPGRVESLVQGFSSYSGAAAGGGLRGTKQGPEAIEAAVEQVLELLLVEQPTPLQAIVLEQLARVVNAQARAAFARARARSGVLPNGRTLLGSVLDPLGLFKASGLVTTDADDARVIAATDALAEIIARAGVQGGGTGGLDVGALSQRELQQVAQSVARKLWARRGAARATSSRFAAVLLRQSLERLDARDTETRLTTTLVRAAAEVSEGVAKQYDK